MARLSAKRTAGRPRRAAGEAAAAAEGLWDRPQLLTWVADLLLLCAAAALAYAALLGVMRLPIFPLRHVVVSGALHKVAPAQLEFAAHKAVAGNFFTVSLDAVRAEFEKQPWVRRASARRLWPDGIELIVEEHRAAARWRPSAGEGEGWLVNTHGEVFAASVAAQLPAFSGPEGSAPLLLSRYQEFAAALSPLGLQPRALALSPRLAWQLELDDGLIVQLGRDDPKHPLSERLARFSAAYGPTRAHLDSAIGTVDMRYRNGFVVRPRAEDKGNT